MLSARWKSSRIDRKAREARPAVTAVFLANGLIFGSWAARIPAVRDRLALSDGELGIVFGCMAAGSLVLMPLAGMAAARWGSRHAAQAAIAGACVFAAVLAAAPSLGVLLVLAFLYGGCFGACGVTMNAHAVALERRYGRPLMAGLHAAFSLGVLAGAALGAVAAHAEIDVRVHLAVVSCGVLLACALLSQRFLPAAEDRVDRSEPLLVRPPRRLAALGALSFSALLIQGAAADWSAVYLKDELGATAATAALAFTAFSVAMTLGRLVGDRLVVRHGTLPVVRAGGALAAAGFAAALVADRPLAGIAGFACLGLGMASVMPIVVRASAAVPDMTAGVALAAVASTGYLGFLIGPPAIGALAELLGLSAALGLLSLLSIAVVALAATTRVVEHPGLAPATEPVRA